MEVRFNVFTVLTIVFLRFHDIILLTLLPPSPLANFYFIISTFFLSLLSSRTQGRNSLFFPQQNTKFFASRNSQNLKVFSHQIHPWPNGKKDNISYKFLMHCLPLITMRREGIQRENAHPPPAPVSTQFSFSLISIDK